MPAVPDAEVPVADVPAPDVPATEETVLAPPVPVLDEPADGLPEVVTTERGLTLAAEAIAGGTGPVALDAERASGFRYSSRAYLVQMRRKGAGTWLIDPIACPDLSPLQEAIGDTEWVLHAATQDLMCLAEVGLRPTRLFDTELGGRLAGLPRVGLSAVVEHYLGLSLAKEHSAADWSERPLPEPWLRYAALDVEVLVEVRDLMAEHLEQQGKSELAAQEFDALTRFTGPPVRTDPWRRTTGAPTIRDRRGLARLRALWHMRDDIAQRRDIAPGRILPDRILSQIAAANPTTDDELQAVASTPGRTAQSRPRPAHRAVVRHRAAILDAIKASNAVPERSLPPRSIRSDAPPPARAWADRDPEAAARLQAVRAALAVESERLAIPVENLLTPDTLRRVLWQPPGPYDIESLTHALSDLGARPWQVELVVPHIMSAVTEHPMTDE
ncbi:HRDC domain-containing protein [Demetria terragena]|uniref:HRDC domain-containing protein n=1 Tax=Demetria terragena TaxID=63959 RepID=UPI00039B6D92|nr:ribonuclease D [Demetria terragena]